MTAGGDGNGSGRALHIVHTESSCGWGGQEIRILTEAKAFNARGHRVDIVCPDDAPLFAAARDSGVPVSALPINRKNITGLTAVYRWLKTRSIDVINTHSSTDSWLTALACRLSRDPPPIVRTRHLSTAVPRNFPTRWLYQTAAAHIVTTGERLRRQLIDDNRYSPASITSVPTGIDPGRFAPGDRISARLALGIPVTAMVIGIVATLRSWKGHRYLIDAFAGIDCVQPHLLIIGAGPQHDSIVARIADKGIAGRVTLPGNQNEVAPWLQAMDIFVLPSYANEGVPQSIVQAMLCGLPVVSTPVGSIEEAVIHEQTGLVVEPENVAALQAAIERLINDEKLRHGFGRRGREVALERFTLDRMVAGMEDVFYRVLR